MCAIQHSSGDHQALVVDVHLLATISKTCFTVVCPPAHWLCCTIPTASDRYLKMLDAYCHYHKLPQKLNALFCLAQGTDLNIHHFHKEMEKFDKIKTDDMQMAKKHCQCFWMGLVQFLPDLN